MMRIAIVSDEKTEYTHKDCTAEFFSSDDGIATTDWGRYAAVFLVTPYTKQALHSWTGHPHLRCVDTAEALDAEIEVLLSHIELEKKYLIRRPDLRKLRKYHPFCSEIEQVYLECLNGSHRIRRRESNGTAEYFETLKIRISGSKCNEFEQTIDEETYRILLDRADKKKHPIRKKRYCFVYHKQYFELDIYEFWKDRGTLELELKDESQVIYLPPEIEVLEDVSDDYRYKNNYLAGVAYEDY